MVIYYINFLTFGYQSRECNDYFREQRITSIGYHSSAGRTERGSILDEEHYHQIIGLLRDAGKGLTIEEISKRLNLSRITTTKYLNSLFVSGQVNMRKLGPAKVYSLSARLPVEQILSQSSDLILILDESYTIRNVSESFLRAFGIRKDELENQNVSTTIVGSGLIDRIRDPVRQAMAGKEAVVNAWIPVQKEWKAFRIRIIPLAFGWGDRGIGLMMEDRTGEIMAQEENALLADLLNESPAAITVSDFEGNFLYSNEKNLDLHGYSQSEFLDLNISHLDISESAKPIDERLEDLKKSGEVSFEVVHIRKDSRQIPLEVHAKIARWGDRDVVIGIATDISERKRSEAALRESERRFSDIIDFLPDATLVVDREGIVIAWNRAMEELTGVKAGDIVGRGDYAYATAMYGERRPFLLDLIFHDGPDVRRDYRHLCREGSTFTAETVLTPPNAGEKFVWLKASPLFDKDGRITGAIESIRDITERKRAEEVRQQQTREPATLNTLAIELAAVPSGQPVEKTILRRLMKMSGTVATWFCDYDPVDRTLRVTDMEIAPGMLEKAVQLLGRRPFDMRIPVSDEIYREITRDIIGKKKTLTEISFGQIPPLVSTSIQKLVGIDRFIGIACVVEGQLYGTMMLAMEGGQKDPSTELLRSFSHIVAVSLRRRRAENALRESGERYRLLLENANDGILVNEMTQRGPGKFLDANDRACRILGMTREELQDVCLVDLDTPEMRDRAPDILREIIRNNHAVFQTNYRTKDDREKFLDISVSLFDLQGRPTMLSVVRDITDRKAMESAFHAMVTGMVGTTGTESLDRICESISAWLGADCIMIGEITPDCERVQVLSMLLDGKKIMDFSYSLRGTPCENTARKGFCVYRMRSAGTSRRAGISGSLISGAMPGHRCAISKGRLSGSSAF